MMMVTMRQLRPLHKTTLALWSVAVCVVALLIIHFVIHQGITPIIFDPINAVIIAGLAIYVLVNGLAVKKIKKGERTWLSHSRAGYVPVIAQASAYFGGMASGLMVAMIIVAVSRIESQLMVKMAIQSSIILVSTLALLIVGLVVEKWCIVDDDDDDEPLSGVGGVASA